MGRLEPCPASGKLLQQIGIGFGAVSYRFEVLAELVDDQKKRCILCQALRDFDRRGCRGVRFGVGHSSSRPQVLA